MTRKRRTHNKQADRKRAIEIEGKEQAGKIEIKRRTDRKKRVQGTSRSDASDLSVRKAGQLSEGKEGQGGLQIL